MAYGLANYKSDLVAAVASVYGVMLERTGSTSHPIPVVHLHGISDMILMDRDKEKKVTLMDVDSFLFFG